MALKYNPLSIKALINLGCLYNELNRLFEAHYYL
jgi:hypothetical protein